MRTRLCPNVVLPAGGNNCRRPGLEINPSKFQTLFLAIYVIINVLRYRRRLWPATCNLKAHAGHFD
jgi:hypothetical protein